MINRVIYATTGKKIQSNKDIAFTDSHKTQKPQNWETNSALYGGFANTEDHLQSTWYHHNDWIPQEYKIYANSVLDEATCRRLEYRHLIKHPKFKYVWTKSIANKFQTLFQGIGKNADGTQRAKGTDTCLWFHKHQIPANKKAKYTSICCSVRPEKTEQERTWITAVGTNRTTKAMLARKQQD